MNYEFLTSFTPRILDVVERNKCFWDEFHYELLRERTKLHTFSYVVEGEGWLELDGERHQLHKGCLFQIRPNTHMRITTQSDNTVCFISFHFKYWSSRWENGEMLLTEGAEIVPVSGQVVHIGQTDIEETFRDAFQLWQSKVDGYEWLVKLAFMNVIQRVNELTAMANSENPTTAAVQKASDYIKNHYQQSISREMIAQHVSLSPGYLSLAFKQVTGLGLTEYLVRMRLDRAKYLLKSSRLPIREISDACGFADSFYFTRVFKKETGMNPRDYRNS
ncbi:AraC family transcriptional regulator [Paenibacillus sp. MAH-36]|uniref:AraC family transcriptional regulator n=1 Tax=Paenibacillus violae TaxID=3077234 RepID=A0ABU3RDM2_9BACL|nr:AraC family transcriptional regulator [Paenibacillus sp. PFR10]MDU0202149.1 AraC family transcriptional regulator [Paenibacillus sp. PFR10]